MTRAVGWEAVFRVRTSTGFRQISTYGNYQIKTKTADLVMCPVIDKDRVLIYELERESQQNAKNEVRKLMVD